MWRNRNGWPVPGAPARSLYSVVLLAAFSMALSLIVAATTPTIPAPAASQAPALPTTQPGISQDEGCFLFTTADDGSTAIYFIAGNSRHSILANDVQLELQVNPLWPTRPVTQDEVLAFPEGAPIGAARAGLLGGTAPEAPAPAPVPAPAPEPEVAPAEPSVYVLRKGDNLTHIARDYGTTVDAILAANGVSNPNRIYAGQPLLIPGPDGSTSVAQKPAPAAPVGEDQTPTTANEPPAGDTTVYTVRPGDSAFKIARRFGVDQSALLEANGINNPNRVYVGQTLAIPS